MPQARDLITVSQNISEYDDPTLSPAFGDQYGDLVTVSTGSDSSSQGEFKRQTLFSSIG